MDETSLDRLWQERLDEQVRRHGRFYFALARRVLRQPAQAEDACQQGFLRVWERRGEIRDPAALKGWLTRVILNECLQMLRRRRLEKETLTWQWQAAESVATATSRPVMVREAVVAALAQLPEEERTVVSLRLLAGLSGNEVKDVLACSAAEVSRRLHRGMERLRDLLAEWNPRAVRSDENVV